MNFPNEKVTRLEAATLTVNHLLNNSTTHESPFSAIAELVDNAYDADAKNLHINICGEHPYERLEFFDDGNGMSREEALSIIKFGFSQKGGCDIGRFGNGLKSGGFHLGRDLLLITKKNNIRTALFISNSFLESQHCRDTVYVPCPSTYTDGSPFCQARIEFDRHTDELDFINQYKRFNGGELTELFDRIPEDENGTLVIISKLQRSPIGELMIDIKSDREDIRIDGEGLPDYKCSLRAYLEILYLHPKMAIHLRDSVVYPKKILANWMARCHLDIPTSSFSEIRDETIRKYNEEKKNLLLKKQGVVTDNAGMNQQRMHHSERKPLMIEHTKYLGEIDADIKLRDQWIAEAEKHSKESTFRSYIGINVGNRDDYGIHFYINNRLIRWGQKSAFFKKASNRVGISMYNELDFKTFLPTHNKQGFSNARDFNLLVKRCDEYLQVYYDWVEKLWLVAHLKSYNGPEENIWQRFWSKYGYTSLPRVPVFNREQQLAIAKDCGHWRLCVLCRKWKRLDSLTDLKGSPEPDMFVCGAKGDKCPGEPKAGESIPEDTKQVDKVSDSAGAMMLPNRRKLDDKIKQIEAKSKKTSAAPPPRPQQETLAKMGSFRRSALATPRSPIASSSAASSEPTASDVPKLKKIKIEVEDDEVIYVSPERDIDFDMDYPSGPSTSSAALRPAREEDLRLAREEDHPQEREQRVHAAKPSEKVSRRRVHDSESEEESSDEEPLTKSRPSTSQATTSSRSEESREAPQRRATRPRQSKKAKLEKQLDALMGGVGILLDHLQMHRTHKLNISEGENVDRFKSVLDQIKEIKEGQKKRKARK